MRKNGALFLVLAMTVLATSGCAENPVKETMALFETKPPVELISYRDPYFPQTIGMAFDECVYRHDLGGDLHMIARRSRPGPAADSGPIEEFVYVHVFWQPNTGRTIARSSTSNAIIRYVVIDDSGAAAYSGTGFVYPKSRLDGQLTVRIESSGLALTAKTHDAKDTLGTIKLTGSLVAREEAQRTVGLQREIDLDLAAPSQNADKSVR